jgi:hypothetical protein
MKATAEFPVREHIETVDEFLARGGRIQTITDHPSPEGRVMRRGHSTGAKGHVPFMFARQTGRQDRPYKNHHRT